MRSLRTGGKIVVTAVKKDKSTLCFEVTDNGVGMSQEQVDNLNGYLNDENQLFSSIGLKNVHRRIKIRYGENFGLTIQSTLGIGTKVTAIIGIETNTVK